MVHTVKQSDSSIQIEVLANNQGPAVREIWNPRAAEQVPTLFMLSLLPVN